MNPETQLLAFHFEYILTPEEFLDGQRIFCSRLGSMWVRLNYKGMILLGLILIAEGICAAILKLGPFAVFLLPALSVFYILNRVIFWPARMKREYTKYPDANGTRTLNIDENGVTAQSSHGRGEMIWSRFSDFAETERMFVLLAPPKFLIAVPKRAIPSEMVDEFRRLLSRKLTPTNSSSSR